MGMASRGIMHLVMMPLAWVGMLYFQQDSIVYRARKAEPLADADVFGGDFSAEALPFRHEMGMQVSYLLRPSGTQVRFVYLVFGGNAMLARDWMSILEFAPDVIEVAKKEGVAFLLVDYPGFGASAGSPSKASIGAAAHGALAAASIALHTPDGPDISFGAIGHSIGCAAALGLAERQLSGEVQLEHLLLSAPFTTLPEMAQQMLPVLKFVPKELIGWLAARNHWDNMAASEQLARSGAAGAAPRVDIVHGDQDEMVPLAMGERLWHHIRSLGMQVSFQKVSAKHNDVLGTEDFRSWLKDGLQEGIAAAKEAEAEAQAALQD